MARRTRQRGAEHVAGALDDRADAACLSAMPFGKLFGRRDRDAAADPDVREGGDAGDAGAPDGIEDAGELPEEPEEPEGDYEPEQADETPPATRAAAILPTGASSGSKRPEALYGDSDAAGPTHFVRAHGCRVVDSWGDSYIDCGMALGAVALGYAEARVTRAVLEAVAAGGVATLSPMREVEVAERLASVIPCAERVQFLKTGAEAVAAAVRLARTYTGRDVVIASGYFGWLDWASDAAGVPAAARADVVRVPFDDIPALEQAVSQAGSRLAAVVLEPVVERLPGPAWAERARALCDGAGAVLVFDEIKTGFRLRTGGYQEYAGVIPDLATFGKAMANGFPLSAVVGRDDVMLAARRTWISSTLASETSALAAAGAVLAWHEEADVSDALWRAGAELREAVRAAIEASGVGGIEIVGIDPMWLLRFDDPARETRFLELAVREGVLFKRGAYNYASIAHDDEVIREVEAAASAACVALRDEERDAQ